MINRGEREFEKKKMTVVVVGEMVGLHLKWLDD